MRQRLGEIWLPWSFVLLGVLLILASFGFSQAWQNGIREVGVISLIAGMATIAVERQRLASYTLAVSKVTADKIEEIKTASLDRLLRGVLPEEFFTLISEVMLEQKFLRREAKMDVIIEWFGESREYLKMYWTYDYTVTNRRMSSEMCDFGASVSREMESQFPGHTKVNYVKAKYEGSDSWFFESVDCLELSVDQLYVQCRSAIPLEGGQSAVVQAQSQRIERNTGEESVFFRSPLEGLDITILRPAELEVSVEPVHPKVAESLVPTATTDFSGLRRTSHSLRHPILPYWGVMLHWHPVRGSAPPKSSGEARIAVS